MGNFIEEFYYGNLDPQARSTKQNKTVQKKMEVLMLNEDFLTETLSGENKKRFLDFVNAWGVVNGQSNLDSFIMGFRLGANFTYDSSCGFGGVCVLDYESQKAFLHELDLVLWLSYVNESRCILLAFVK